MCFYKCLTSSLRGHGNFLVKKLSIFYKVFLTFKNVVEICRFCVKKKPYNLNFQTNFHCFLLKNEPFQFAFSRQLSAAPEILLICFIRPIYTYIIVYSFTFNNFFYFVLF